MIGYNVDKANDLMEKIAEAYKNLGIYTKEQWNGVLYTIQGNWIGEDEQSFEKELAKRICTLYMDACNLADSAVKTISGLAESWRKFQQTNILEGAEGSTDSKFNIKVPTITKDEEVVKANIKTIANDANRGLQSETSGQTIKDKITEFVGQIKEKTNGLFSQIDSGTAFFGNQTTGINAYVEKVGQAIGEVTVAVKDMFDALDKLVVSNYSTANQDITEQFKQAEGTVNDTVNDLGSKKWSAE